MKEFKCISLGNDCSWRHVAKTEELLADMAALHLRDAHGLDALSPDMVGRIKNSFSNPSPMDEQTYEALTMKEFRCLDIGQDCNWHYIAQTEDLIADGAAVHAREAHGIREFTPEMMTRVKNTIHEWKG
jgi:predicted small metal-binding protein